MQILDVFDVIIVGAGPSGSTLGYYLSHKGFKVLIIEKKKLPGYKPCGGGITRRASNILPFDFNHVVEDYSLTAKILLNNKEVFSKAFDSPVVSMVMRDKFDLFLINKAKEQGVVVKYKTKFLSIDGDPGRLTVKTSEGYYKTNIIVGADGVLSKVAKELKLNIDYKIMVALGAEIYFSDKKILDRYKNTVHSDFGVIRHGYGWVFPKNDHLSVGVLSVVRKEKSIKSQFYKYLKTKKLDENSEIKTLRAHLIPYNPAKGNRYANDKGLIIGDASGHVDPITGEGVYYAIKGAQIAAKTIINYLNNDIQSLEIFNVELKRQITKDLERANFLASLLYSFPAFGYKVLQIYGQQLGEKHLKVITGKKSYSELFRELLNPLIIFDLLFLIVNKLKVIK